MGQRLASYRDNLEALGRRNRRRGLRDRAGHDFASNDYLGLASSPELAEAAHAALARGVPVGAAGSRLLRGNHFEHEALEEEAATFFGARRCLFFGSGYDANLALFSTLPQTGDLVVYDELSHASTREGLRLGRAEVRCARHNDVEDVEAGIKAWRAGGGRGTPWVAVESLYSMDGDLAPLRDLLTVVESHDGFLVVDEAHATGVLGPGGRGLAAAFEGREAVLTVHTCGKALGVSGALVAADGVLIDFLVNRARPFIYATAPSPLTAAVVRAALQLIEAQPERRGRLHALVQHAREGLRSRLGLDGGGAQILPLVLGDDARALRAALELEAAGFDCRAIRPPTVPEGTARLRIAITLNVDEGAISGLIDALARPGLALAA
ncbi:MAG: 8-amino-7-oxononanoate synthase [Proteobacteria bacterium]|nr:8-amino-7-oxononanoate synthase [Pseudomonadota bacterium]